MTNTVRFLALVLVHACAVLNCGVRGAPFVVRAPSQCSTWGNCTAVLQRAFADCPPSGCEVLLDSEAPYIMKPPTPRASFAFYIAGMNNLWIHGPPPPQSAAVFNVTWITQFFIIVDSTNVTVENIVWDMVRPPYTLGVVTANPTPGSSTLHITDQSLYPVDAATVENFPYLTVAQAFIGYDPQVEQFIGPDIYLLNSPLSVAYSGAGVATVNRSLQVGEWILIRHQVYVYNVFYFAWCTNVRVRRVTLYAAGGMGLIAMMTRDLTLDGYETRRRRFPDGRVRAMSITADGIHICNSLGGAVRIVNSTLEGQGDDGLNINTRFSRIGHISSDRRSVTFDTSATYAPGAGAFLPQRNLTFRAEIFNGQTMETRGVSPPITGGDRANETVDFASPLPPGVMPYDLAVNWEQFAHSTLIDSTTFLNNRARGALLKQPNVLVRNCTFSGMTSPAILTEVDGCYWFEGRPVQNWTIIDSTFANVDRWGAFEWIRVHGSVPVFEDGKPTTQCADVAVPDVFRYIRVESNRFVWTQNDSFPFASMFALHSGSNVTVRGNTVMRTTAPAVQQQQLDFAFFPKYINVVVANNICTAESALYSCASNE